MEQRGLMKPAPMTKRTRSKNVRMQAFVIKPKENVFVCKGLKALPVNVSSAQDPIFHVAIMGIA